MKQNKFLILSFFFFFLFLNSQTTSIIGQTQISYLADIGDIQVFEITSYYFDGKSSQILKKTDLNGNSYQVEFKEGMITTVEITEIKSYENGTTQPLGKISYGDTTLDLNNLQTYIFPTINNISYWKDLARTFLNVKIENDSIISIDLETETFISIEKFFWKTGWLAYSYKETFNESGATLSELEIQNLSYVRPNTLSNDIIFMVGSLFVLVLVNKLRKRKT